MTQIKIPLGAPPHIAPHVDAVMQSSAELRQALLDILSPVGIQPAPAGWQIRAQPMPAIDGFLQSLSRHIDTVVMLRLAEARHLSGDITKAGTDRHK